MHEATISAAVNRLNERLKTLPDWLGCAMEDLYPDFDFPECGPEMYLALLEDEAKQVKARIEQAEESQQAPLRQLLLMLIECAVVLRLAGVEPVLPDEPEEAGPLLLASEAQIDADLHEPPAGSNGPQPNE